jgi:hypothetical protein
MNGETFCKPHFKVRQICGPPIIFGEGHRPRPVITCGDPLNNCCMYLISMATGTVTGHPIRAHDRFNLLTPLGCLVEYSNFSSRKVTTTRVRNGFSSWDSVSTWCSRAV